MPEGAQRHRLQVAVGAFFEKVIAGTLSSDYPAAVEYAEILARRRRAGHPISVLDAQIAAIVKAHNAMVATRHTADFEGCGINLINPYDNAETTIVL